MKNDCLETEPASGPGAGSEGEAIAGPVAARIGEKDAPAEDPALETDGSRAEGGMPPDQQPTAEKSPQGITGSVLGTKPRGTSLKFVPPEPVPEPPRKPSGKIDWRQITGEHLAALAKKYPVTQIAAAWGISPSTLFKFTRKYGIKTGGGMWTTIAAQQRRELLAATNPPAPSPPRKPRPWDRPASFLRELWHIGAPGIAAKYECDYTILYDHADALGLSRPPRGFFLRKRREIPGEVLALIAKLEEEQGQAEGGAKKTGPATSAPAEPTSTGQADIETCTGEVAPSGTEMPVYLL